MALTFVSVIIPRSSSPSRRWSSSRPRSTSSRASPGSGSGSESRRSSPRTCCSTSASCCCSCGPPVGHGPDPRRGELRPVRDAWRTFWQITFPQLLPAVVAGFLLSFTFSFDDFVITSFVSGPGSSTLPLYVFGQIKTGVTPATNAVAGADAADHAGRPVRRPVADAARPAAASRSRRSSPSRRSADAASAVMYP